MEVEKTNTPLSWELASQLILEKLDKLQSEFESKITYDKSKDRLLDTLHEDLQKQREGMHWRILQPVFQDLIALHDDLVKQEQTVRAWPDDPPAREMARILGLFQAQTEEILRRYGVEMFESPGGRYNAETQRVVNAFETHDSKLDQVIANRLRKGFRYEMRVLRPEWVEIYRFRSDVSGMER